MLSLGCKYDYSKGTLNAEMPVELWPEVRLFYLNLDELSEQMIVVRKLLQDALDLKQEGGTCL